jgi:hypothetical protein
MKDNLDSFQKLVSTRRTFSISIDLDCRDPQAYGFLNFTFFINTNLAKAGEALSRL